MSWVQKERARHEVSHHNTAREPCRMDTQAWAVAARVVVVAGPYSMRCALPTRASFSGPFMALNGPYTARQLPHPHAPGLLLDSPFSNLTVAALHHPSALPFRIIPVVRDVLLASLREKFSTLDLITQVRPVRPSQHRRPIRHNDTISKPRGQRRTCVALAVVHNPLCVMIAQSAALYAHHPPFVFITPRCHTPC